MKRFVRIASSLAVCALLSASATPAQIARQQNQWLSNPKTARTIMSQIAADDSLRSAMLSQMIQTIQSDSTKMQAFLGTLLADGQTRSLVRGMLANPGQVAVGSGEEILIKFKSGADEAQIKELAAEFGLQQIRSIPQLRVRVFRVGSAQNLKSVIASCQKKTYVEYVEPNQKYKTQN